jgi:hypothetical protein
MADKDYTIRVSEDGSDKVIKAFNDISAAEDKAAKGAEDLGKASGNAQSRMSRLGAVLKEGAGQAAGAAAASVGLATALNDGITEGGNKAIASLSALSGVAGAFGPIGQLVATGASLAATAIGIFSGEAEEAYEPTRNLREEWEAMGSKGGFLSQSLGKLASEFDKLAKETNKAKAAQDAFYAGVDDSVLLTEAQRATGTALNSILADQKARVDQLRGSLDELSAAQKAGTVPLEVFRNTQSALGGVLSSAQGDYKRTKDALDNYVKSLKETEKTEEKKVVSTKAASKSIVEAAQEELQVFSAFLDTISSSTDSFLLSNAQKAADILKGYKAAATEAAAISSEIQQTDELMQIQQEGEAAIAVYTDLGNQMSAFGDAAAMGFAQAAAGAILYGEGMKEAANAALNALALQATTEALFQTAKGLAALGLGLLGFGPGIAAANAHFASAAAFAGIAAISAGGAAATGGLNAPGGGGGSGGGSGGAGSSSDLGPNSNSGGGGPVQNTYIIQNSGVIGLDRDLDRRFAEGTRREQQRPGGIRQGRR